MNLKKAPQRVEHYHQLQICSSATKYHPIQAREEASSSGMLERPPEKNVGMYIQKKISVKITFGQRDRYVEKGYLVNEKL